MTNEQEVVVCKKLQQGYKLFGFSTSIVNGLDVVILSKNRHTVAINSLGYDEHYKGKTWKLNSGAS